MTINTIMETLRELNAWSAALRIVLSVLMGGCIGLERGRHGRAAGLRTHILVCTGSAMATLVGVYSVSVLQLTGDPLRVGAQVVSGIGFLGAGIILVRDGSRVTGLTTAAGLWATACLGLVIGIGFYFAALVAFVAILITITFLIWLEMKTKNKNPYTCYVECADSHRLKALYHDFKPYISRADVVPAKSGIASHIGLEIKADSASEYELLLKKAEDNDDVIIALPLQN